MFPDILSTVSDQPSQVFNLTRFYAASFLSALNNLYMALGVCGNDVDYSESQVREKCHMAVSGMAHELSDAGLSALAGKAERFDKNIDHYSPIQLMPLILTFRDDIIAEVIGNLFLRLDPDKRALYQNPVLSAQAVAIFPDAERDMSAAARCLSLDEYDACVFHSMKVLEIGLVWMAEKFGVRTQHQNWQNIINDIQGKVKGICEQTHGLEWKAREQFSPMPSLISNF